MWGALQEKCKQILSAFPAPLPHPFTVFLLVNESKISLIYSRFSFSRLFFFFVLFAVGHTLHGPSRHCIISIGLHSFDYHGPSLYHTLCTTRPHPQQRFGPGVCDYVLFGSSVLLQLLPVVRRKPILSYGGNCYHQLLFPIFPCIIGIPLTLEKSKRTVKKGARRLRTPL